MGSRSGLGKNGLFISKHVQEEHEKRMHAEKVERAGRCRAVVLEILERFRCRQTAVVTVGQSGNQVQVMLQALDVHEPIIIGRARELWLKINSRARNAFTTQMAELQRATDKEMTDRAIECRQEVEAALKLYNCTQSAVMQIAEGRVVPQVMIVGLDGGA